MTNARLHARFRAAVLALSTLLLASPALAAGGAFRLDVTQPRLTVGETATLDVRLVRVDTGKPVEGAVIFRTRLDMAPDGMAQMAEPLTPVAAAEPGVHRFRTTPTMAGRWALSVQAKVPGETETVTASTVLTAVLPPDAGPAGSKAGGHAHGH